MRSSCCLSCDATIVTAVILVFWLVLQQLNTLPGLSETSKKALRVCVNLVGAVVIAMVVALGVLEKNEDLRNWAFSELCRGMTKSPLMNEARCDLLESASGVLLEFGTGPGTNFKCWGQENQNITHYIGIEPNRYFEPVIHDEKKKYALEFEMTMLYSRGEDQALEIADSSVDSVVGTHLLCSVGDDNVLHSILSEVDRVLKPGGVFYFLEHVSAPEGSVMHFMQYLASPFFRIVGNGCRFRPVWQDLEKFADQNDFDLSISHWDAPMPFFMPILKPHIKGIARKRK